MGHIKANFNHYHYITPAEFILAFNWNVMGLYPEIVQHYQSFDLTFFCTVMRYFRHRKSESMKEVEQSEKPKELPRPASTDEDYYTGLVDYFKEKNEMPIGWDFDAAYRHMNATGMITESTEWKKQFRAGIEEKMKADIVAKKMKTRNEIERMNLDATFNPGNIKSICQKEYVIMKIKQMHQ